MLIQVTADHIKNGQPRNACACPVAIAVYQATGRVLVEVDAERIKVAGVTFETPHLVRKFIARFDRGESVEPFTFELAVTPWHVA